MMSIRKWIRDLFGFSGNEINGFIILIPLMVLLLSSEPLYHSWTASRNQRFLLEPAPWDSALLILDTAYSEALVTPAKHVTSFDPNSATVEELRVLGFSEILAKRIAAYRTKGGVFRVKSDLLKIYGLDSTLYKQLYDRIKLPTTRSLASGDRPNLQTPQIWNRKQERQKKFDINTADTLLLKSIYGIGSRLAARIIKFRDGLGGFVRQEQLYEVYGLDSLTIDELLKVAHINNDFKPQQININAATEKQLSAHPYIRFKLARLLVSYRFQHGDFRDVSDIKKLSALKPEEMERLLPYLKVKD